MPTVASFAELRRAIDKDVGHDLRSRLEAAINKTVEDSVAIVQARVPRAFDELHDSIHAAGRRLVADAPHAAPVEVGSVPHMPPVAPLVKWAALRGFDDPERAAWGIAIKISKEGTRPRWYMRGSLPAIRDKLAENMRRAAHGQGAAADTSAAAKRAAIGEATGSTASVAAKFGVSSSTVRRIRAERAAGGVRSDSRIRIK